MNNVVAIAAGGAHNLALKADGTVVAWGYNNHGQLNVPPALSNVVAIAAGGDHSLALKSDGTVVAWGDNSYGESKVPPGLGPAIAIAAGFHDSTAIVLPTRPSLREQVHPEAIVLSWPSVYFGFTLQSSDSLSAADWKEWPTNPGIHDGWFWVTNPISAGSQFFRLKK